MAIDKYAIEKTSCFFNRTSFFKTRRSERRTSLCDKICKSLRSYNYGN